MVEATIASNNCSATRGLKYKKRFDNNTFNAFSPLLYAGRVFQQNPPVPVRCVETPSGHRTETR